MHVPNMFKKLGEFIMSRDDTKQYTEMELPFYFKGDKISRSTKKGIIYGEVVGIEGTKVRCLMYGKDSDTLVTYKQDEVDLEEEVTNTSTHAIHKNYYKPSKDVGFKLKNCNHWMDPFQLRDDLTIYLSAKSTPSPKRKSDIDPTVGCYMDRGWTYSSTFWLTPHAPDDSEDVLLNDDEQYPNLLFSKETIPSMYIDWPDMGIIPLMEYSQAVVWCMRRLMDDEVLEIGCHGAHGRTGTLLAGILVYQGLTAEEAIKEVKAKHCSHAIETKTQEDLIKRYDTARREQEDDNLIG